jgi:hypothetical protein
MPGVTHNKSSFDTRSLHHKPGAICVACTINALAESVDTLLAAQTQLYEVHPNTTYPRYNDDLWAVKSLGSSAELSIQYMIENLLNQDIVEFEAYLSVSRNLLEKLCKIEDIISDREKLLRSSDEFKQTVSDITQIFECNDASATTLSMKRANFLGRGINLSNLPGDKYRLSFAYLSRAIHSYNMDSLLDPSYDRFIVKSYMLILIGELYHSVSAKLPHISKEAAGIHSKCSNTIKSFWLKKGVTVESLIYWTTFYDDIHTESEKEVINRYNLTLAKSLEHFKDKGIIALPKIILKDEILSIKIGKQLVQAWIDSM